MSIITLEKAAETALGCLQVEGHEAYLVGGCVRDLILRKKPKDYDIVTSATPDQVRDIFKKTIPVGAKFGIVLVVIDDHHLEIATMRKDGAYSDNRRPDSVAYTTEIREDLQRRDFTMNGILMRSVTGSARDIVDFVGGFADIKRQYIRCIGKPDERFQEDALRMMRAIRFAAQLGFSIVPETWEAIQRNKRLIRNISKERVCTELVKALTAPFALHGLSLFAASGLLEELFEEVMHCKFAWLLKKFCLFPTTDPLKALAMFISECSSREDGAVLARLKLSTADYQTILNAKRHSEYLWDGDSWSAAKVKRWLRVPGAQLAIDLFEINRKTNGLMPANTVDKICNRFRSVTPEEIRPKPLISGDDLIKLGMKPGPKFKEILAIVETFQLDGRLTNTNEALNWVRYQLDGKEVNGEATTA